MVAYTTQPAGISTKRPGSTRFYKLIVLVIGATSITAPVTLNGTLAVSTATVVTTPTAVTTTMAVQPCSINNTTTIVNVFNTDIPSDIQPNTATLINIIPGTGYLCDSMRKCVNL